MYQLIDEIQRRLFPFNIKEDAAVNRIGLSVHHKNMILKVCIAGAFYPNYFLRASCISSEEQERQIYHELNGRDPTSTIYYRGIGKDDMGMLYEDQVKNFLKGKNVIKSKDDVSVSFDEGCQKMFVTFNETKDVMSAECLNDSLPGKIKTQIYKSIKLTRERQTLHLKVLDENEKFKYRRENAENIKAKSYMKILCCVPKLHEKTIDGFITSVRTPDKFWIRRKDEKVLDVIQKVLIETPLYPVHNFDGIVGMKVAVEIEEYLYRAKVQSVIEGKNGAKFKVFLFDEGTEKTVEGKNFKLNTK